MSGLASTVCPPYFDMTAWRHLVAPVCDRVPSDKSKLLSFYHVAGVPCMEEDGATVRM
jgi:hypothetical protein